MVERDLWYTLGPTSLGKERDLLQCGATGVRLTFGFGTPSLHYERAILHRNIATDLGRKCLIVADLNGEKFRLGRFEGAATIPVAANTEVHLVSAEVSVSSAENPLLPIPSQSFFSYLRTGTILTIGDGAILQVTRTSQDEAYAQMINDGVLNQARGINIQGKEFRPQSLTAKDLKDLDHILSSSVYDIVALSFVSSEDDVLFVKDLARKAGSAIQVLAKVETAAGLDNIDAICRSADMVMAARGDLGLSIPWIDLPDAVDRIVHSAKSNDTPWILATQIVEGLEHFAIPTRAEICDLAHWLQKGCSGILLSTETAFGSRPIDAVACTSSMLKRYGQVTGGRAL